MIQVTQQSAKLRSSCDACTIAKVKCDKSQPHCTRCSNNGLQCSYSVSRRHGKRPSNRRTTSVEACTSGQPPHTIQQYPTPTPSHPAPIPAYNPRIEHDVLGTWQYADSNVSRETLSSWSNVSLGDFPIQLGTSTTQSPMDFTISAMAFQEPQDNSASPALPGSPLDNTSRNTRLSALAPTEMFTESSSMPSRHDSLVDVGGAVSRADCGPDSRDCEARALEVLDSLRLFNLQSHTAQTQPMHGHIERCESRHSAMGLEATSRPGLDKILLTNKLALASVMKLLDCACACHAHVALLYLTIVNKALFWYKTAAAMLSPPISVSLGSLSSPMNTVHASMVQIGGFDLDDDDQEDLTREILARELRRVGRVLTKLSAIAGSDPNDYSAAVHWHSHFFSTAHRDLQKVIRSLKVAG